MALAPCLEAPSTLSQCCASLSTREASFIALQILELFFSSSVAAATAGRLRAQMPVEFIVAREENSRALHAVVVKRRAQKTEQADQFLEASMLALSDVLDSRNRDSVDCGYGSNNLASASALAEVRKFLDQGNASRALETLSFSLFGPAAAHTKINNTNKMKNLRHWLHLERAALLNDIVRKKGLHNVHLDSVEKARLRFLVEVDADTLARAHLEGPLQDDGNCNTNL